MESFNKDIWRIPSLSELTSYYISLELAHLDSETSIFYMEEWNANWQICNEI